jgi:hypothetical protein
MTLGNKARINEEEVNLTRNQLEHRATWMALIYAEVKKATSPAKAEEIFRKAIHKCGNIHGLNFKRACKDPENICDFEKVFLNDNGKKNFEMEVKRLDHDNLKIEFHYCALLNAWKKLGLSDKECALLCDMAMDGDRGIAESMGIKLDLPETIAKGNSVCKLHFHK